ncbi:MAG: zinc-ribbon domain-containing protein [Promethearchaeota archaeon]
MFCPECGVELIAPNQKYCHNCGTDTRATSKSSNYKIEQLQNEPVSKMYYVPIKPKIELQRSPPGKYSNISFWFALVSIILGFASFYIGSYMGFPYMYYNYAEYNIGSRIGLYFIILSLRAGGLILGIISRISNSKAIELEPYNDLEKAGSIIGIFGIIVNAIGLVFSAIAPISLLRAVPDYYY